MPIRDRIDILNIRHPTVSRTGRSMSNLLETEAISPSGSAETLSTHGPLQRLISVNVFCIKSNTSIY